MSENTDPMPVRPTDPQTSYDAAVKAVAGASRVRPVVLAILVDADEPMTHDEIISAYRMRLYTHPETPKASDSGIRTRLRELYAGGLVEKAEARGKSAYGNSATLWQAATQDQALRNIAANAAAIPDDEDEEEDEDDSDD